MFWILTKPFDSVDHQTLWRQMKYICTTEFLKSLSVLSSLLPGYKMKSTVWRRVSDGFNEN